MLKCRFSGELEALASMRLGEWQTGFVLIQVLLGWFGQINAFDATSRELFGDFTAPLPCAAANVQDSFRVLVRQALDGSEPIPISQQAFYEQVLPPQSVVFGLS